MCVWRIIAVLLCGLMSGAMWAQSNVQSFIVTPAGG
jgi:ribose/xylose/arabinose/galactoside ABC-type transport system permease subunit